MKEKKQVGYPPKYGLISKTHKLWNPRLEFNQET